MLSFSAASALPFLLLSFESLLALDRQPGPIIGVSRRANTKDARISGGTALGAVLAEAPANQCVIGTLVEIRRASR